MRTVDKGLGFLVMKPAAVLALVLALSACGLPVFYRVPVVQGNVVTSDQIEQLRYGMSKEQVAYVMGTPLIKAPFQQDRWSYVFYYRNPRANVRQSKLDVFFENGGLSQIQGDEDYQAAIAKVGNQEGVSEEAPLPGEVSSTGEPLGVQIRQSEEIQPVPEQSNDPTPTSPVEPQDTPAGIDDRRIERPVPSDVGPDETGAPQLPGEPRDPLGD